MLPAVSNNVILCDSMEASGYYCSIINPTMISTPNQDQSYEPHSLFGALCKVVGMTRLVALMLMVSLAIGSYAQEIKQSALEDVVIMQDGTSAQCLITAVDAQTIQYRNLANQVTKVNVADVLTFYVGSQARLEALSVPTAVYVQKYQNAQDLFLLQSGKRLLTTLLDINSLYFVVQRSLQDTTRLDIPIDSVVSFNTNKPFLKRALEDFPSVNRLYAPIQDLDKIAQKDRGTTNWNADYIVLRNGDVVRGVIIDADSTSSLTYIPAYFAEHSFRPITLPWSAIRGIDYWPDPNPFHEPRWYKHTRQYQEPILKSVLTREIDGNSQFILTKLPDEQRVAASKMRWKLLEGTVLLAGGFCTFGWGYQQLGINQRASNDPGVVASSVGMAAGLAIMGVSYYSLAEGIHNIRVYFRLRHIQKTLQITPTGTGVSMRYRF